jgi:F-type H+-transporting ATPase subunit c
MESNVLFGLVISIAPLVAMVLGSILPALMEGRAVLKAFDSMARQPEVANDVRTTLIVSLAMLETTAIYVLLICLIVLFANPLLALISS